MKKLYSLFAVAAITVSAYAQTTVLTEDFATITTGNSTANTGSGTVWTGNANFPTVAAAYQAGGAVKLGTSTAIGSITSKTVDLSTNEGKVKVTFDVKGWTTVEGDIIVTITGQAPKTVTYTATMSSATFDTRSVTFTGGVANSTVKIETTAKRAYIDNIKVVTDSSVLAVSDVNAAKANLVKNTVVDSNILFSAKADVKVVSMNGQVVKSASVNENSSLNVADLAKGTYIVTGIVNGKAVSEKIIKK